MHPFQIVCIHGFLGKASDWDLVLPSYDRLIKIDLFSANKTRLDDYASDNFSLPALGNFVNSRVNPNQPAVLIGYSLGGRIALHSIIQAPHLYKGVVIVSANPGLASLEMRAERIKHDEQWAQRFEHEEWKNVIRVWNQQPTLAGSKELFDANTSTDDNGFSRKALAASLRQASLGRQEDLRTQLGALDLPILWIVGENDPKFVSFGKEMPNILKNGRLTIIENSGHRAPWDQPSQFEDLIKKFTSAL